MTTIVQKSDPVLRKVAEIIEPSDITSSHIQKILKHMHQALANTSNGVALAAPQIGKSLRIFIVAGYIFSPRNAEGELLETKPDLVFINPILTKRSSEEEWIDEGCLSVEYINGKVLRAQEATVQAYDETGQQFTMDGSGLLAQIFQHEIDHLNGILFIDKAKDLHKLTPEEWQ